MLKIVTLTILHGVSCLMPLQMKLNETSHTLFTFYPVFVSEAVSTSLDSVLAKTKVGGGK